MVIDRDRVRVRVRVSVRNVNGTCAVSQWPWGIVGI